MYKIGDAVQVQSDLNPNKWFEDYFVVRVESNAYVVARHIYSDYPNGEKHSQCAGSLMRIKAEYLRPQEKAPRILPPLYAWKPVDFCKYAETMNKGRSVLDYDEMRRC